jgi:CRISPR-associated protein Csd2
MSKTVDRRYEFVLFFDVENGNPNGDPDAGNMPRTDPETSHGLVTDVCLKRKIRNYVELTRAGQDGFEIYVKEGVVLNTQHRRAYTDQNIEPVSKKLANNELTKFMCEHFYDIRTFGAVMTTEVNCGQVRGPVQLNFARSIDPIVPQEVTITRVAVTSEKDAERKDREMGRKHIVPYALYRSEGYVSAPLAERTTFSEEDLSLLWEALINMFDHDHSAARGKMASRRLYAFEHESRIGNAPAHRLFDCITAVRRDPTAPARKFDDYEVRVNEAAVPGGVKLLALI